MTFRYGDQRGNAFADGLMSGFNFIDSIYARKEAQRLARAQEARASEEWQLRKADRERLFREDALDKNAVGFTNLAASVDFDELSESPEYRQVVQQLHDDYAKITGKVSGTDFNSQIRDLGVNAQQRLQNYGELNRSGDLRRELTGAQRELLGFLAPVDEPQAPNQPQGTQPTLLDVVGSPQPQQPPPPRPGMAPAAARFARPAAPTAADAVSELQGQFGTRRPPTTLQPTTPNGLAVTADQAISNVFQREGYESNNPNDRGGFTRFGISQNANPDVDVPQLSREDAARVYKERYWDAIGADNLPENMREVAFDAAVHHGVGAAQKMLRQAGNDPAKFLELRRQLMADIVKNDPSQAEFANGWLRRVDDLAASLSPIGTAQADTDNPSAGRTTLGNVPARTVRSQAQQELEKLQDMRRALQTPSNERNRFGLLPDVLLAPVGMGSPAYTADRKKIAETFPETRDMSVGEFKNWYETIDEKLRARQTELEATVKSESERASRATLSASSRRLGERGIRISTEEAVDLATSASENSRAPTQPTTLDDVRGAISQARVATTQVNRVIDPSTPTRRPNEKQRAAILKLAEYGKLTTTETVSLLKYGKLPGDGDYEFRVVDGNVVRINKKTGETDKVYDGFADRARDKVGLAAIERLVDPNARGADGLTRQQRSKANLESIDKFVASMAKEKGKSEAAIRDIIFSELSSPRLLTLKGVSQSAQSPIGDGNAATVKLEELDNNILNSFLGATTRAMETGGYFSRSLNTYDVIARDTPDLFAPQVNAAQIDQYRNWFNSAEGRKQLQELNPALNDTVIDKIVRLPDDELVVLLNDETILGSDQ